MIVAALILSLIVILMLYPWDAWADGWLVWIFVKFLPMAVVLYIVFVLGAIFTRNT